MSKRKHMLQIESQQSNTNNQYWSGDRVACTLPFAIRGVVFGTPETSPIAGCYQVREDSGVEWFVLPEEIVGRVDASMEVCV